jgi:hypothetical protein
MMKWFIACIIVVMIGVAILCIQCISVTYIIVDDAVTEQQRNNLLILYDIK